MALWAKRSGVRASRLFNGIEVRNGMPPTWAEQFKADPGGDELNADRTGSELPLVAPAVPGEQSSNVGTPLASSNPTTLERPCLRQK